MNLHFLTHEFARANKRHTTYPSLRHLLELRHCLSVQIEMRQHLVPLMGPMSRTHLPSAGQPVQGQINIPLEALMCQEYFKVLETNVLCWVNADMNPSGFDLFSVLTQHLIWWFFQHWFSSEFNLLGLTTINIEPTYQNCNPMFGKPSYNVIVWYD